MSKHTTLIHWGASGSIHASAECGSASHRVVSTVAVVTCSRCLAKAARHQKQDGQVSAHIPGPWVSSDRLTGGTIDVTPAMNPSIQVARVNGKAGEQEANAHLIAAAPDLLTALKLALAELDDQLVRVDCRATVEAAIAKATGK